MRKARLKNSLGLSSGQNKDKHKINTVLINKALIRHKSLNRRQLSQITDIEICTICKPLCDAVKYGSLIISHYALCPLKKSKRKVMYFSLAKAGGVSV